MYSKYFPWPRRRVPPRLLSGFRMHVQREIHELLIELYRHNLLRVTEAPDVFQHNADTPCR